jgi:hypothetical protein
MERVTHFFNVAHLDSDFRWNDGKKPARTQVRG